MKKSILIAVMIIMGMSFQIKAQDYYDRGYNNPGYDNGGFGYFYTSLSPYGMWIEFGDGVYGWRPYNMRSAWAPYANGQWVWTSDGWYWDSYEPFGYIVYHYGRWYYDDYYGWMWIPDYQWAPAWVEWRYDNDYIGWTPLPPYAVFSISIGIHFTHVYNTPYARWHFVQYGHFCDPYVGKYFVGDTYKYRIYSRTKYRDDYGYRDGRVINRGVDVNVIKQRGKMDIRERNIRTVSDLRDINNGNRITNNEVRTFIPGRNNFTDAKVRDMKIEKTDRKTSLETSKLEFGKRNVERKDTPVRTNETNTREVQKEKKNVKIERNTTRTNVEQKGKVPNTGTRTNERKEVKKPVQKPLDRKDPRMMTSGRTETSQRIENRTGNVAEKNNNSRIEKRTYTPPVQKKSEVSVNTRNNRSSGTERNSTTQRQEKRGNGRTGRK